MRYSLLCAPLVIGFLVSACGASQQDTADQTTVITAIAETDAVGTVGDDAADDPAIWRNPDNPAGSLIIGTDKKAGLYVYDLKGREKSFLAATAINNVDLRMVASSSGSMALVGASKRSDKQKPQLALFKLDTDDGTLTPLIDIPLGQGEAYGFCFGLLAAADLAWFPQDRTNVV